MAPRLYVLLAASFVLYLTSAQHCHTADGDPIHCDYLEPDLQTLHKSPEFSDDLSEGPGGPADKKRVAIIGAGPAGLVTAKNAMAEGFNVVVYEQKNTVGGVWQYTDKKDPYAGMYVGMRTNSPKQIMMLKGLEFPENDKTFMEPGPVLEYLKNYQKLNRIPVQLKKTVTKVARNDGKWQVIVKDERGASKAEVFDAVFVCNGHFFSPKKLFPDPSKFEGTYIHSQDYRDAKHYAGRTLVVIGAGPSGIDIAQLAAVEAKTVYLIGSTAKYQGIRWNVKQKTKRVEEIGPNWVRLNDGERIENVDDIVFCIGFEYKFPFLSEDIIQVSEGGQVVSPLYEHVLHRDYPTSLFFIGINSGVSHFVLNEQQAVYAIRILSGKANLPSKEELTNWGPNHRKQCAKPSEMHDLGNMQWPYMQNLSRLGDFEYWPYYNNMEKMFHYTIWSRNNRIADYKDIEFVADWNAMDFKAIMPEKKKKLRIAVIGAGPGGLPAARHALDDGHTVVVYEQRASAGGVWHYTDAKDPYAGMYKGMKTNSPKELMLFKGYPFPESLPSFLEPQAVLDWLQYYGSDIPIKFNTTVTSIVRSAGLWQIIGVKNNKREIDYFDAVMVSNGHFFAKKKLMDYSKFAGDMSMAPEDKVIHSQDYRSPDNYKGKNVAIVGAGPSGIDLAMLIAPVANVVHLIGSKANYKGIPHNVQQHTKRVAAVYDRIVEMSDSEGTSKEDLLIHDVDALIFCTGFDYAYPFFEKDLVQVSPSGQRVSPTYQHVLHTKFPTSLFFIGLNNLVSHFPLQEQQARYALNVATGRAPVPNKEELEGWEKKRLEEKKGRDGDFHTLSDEQWPYMRTLAAIGNFPQWNYYDLVMEPMFKYTNAKRVERLVDYKLMNFTLLSSRGDKFDGFAVQLPPPLKKYTSVGTNSAADAA